MDHDINQDYLFTLIWEIVPGANKKYNAYITMIIQILSTVMVKTTSLILFALMQRIYVYFICAKYSFSDCEINIKIA